MKCEYCGCNLILDWRGKCKSCGAEPKQDAPGNQIKSLGKIEFRDFKGICGKCGSEFYAKHLEGDLIFEDQNIWVVKVYPDEQTQCGVCGETNKVTRIFKAPSFERMARGE